MPNGYLPTRQAQYAEWTAQLHAQLTADPAAFGQTTDSLAPFVAAYSAFAAAYATASDRATRTPPNIEAKNDARQALTAVIRPLVQTLQNWPGMTNAKRELLEIPLRDREPTAIAPPGEMPVLRVKAVEGHVLDLELLNNENRKKKPAGARAAWLYTHAMTAEQPTPPTDLKKWQFQGETTRSNPTLPISEDVAPGTAVWVTALWVSPTGKPGPACAPVKTHINFQGLSQAA